MNNPNNSYTKFYHLGMAIDPIHVGTGGNRLGRVDSTIVRDPATQIPKIPGSSLAGTYRSYSAMAEGKYPQCAGVGLPQPDGTGGHCGKSDCPICTVYGFARGQEGGFAGLAAFSDAHVLLFPVPTRKGVYWITSPNTMRFFSIEIELSQSAGLYLLEPTNSNSPLNLGWLMLPIMGLKKEVVNKIQEKLQDLKVPDYVIEKVGVVSDDLFAHVVNSNLEVRTSVSINPETGAAEDGALFTYEALPRTTFIYWEIVCKNPNHYRINSKPVSFKQNPQMEDVHDITQKAHPFFEHLGIGGMGTRGMGRIKVLV